MSDLEPVGNKEISDAGVKGIGATIGGVGLLIVQGVAGFLGGLVGLVVGGIAVVLGAGSLASKSSTDRRGGAIALAAGAVLALPGLAHLLGGVPIVGSILKVAGGFSAFVVGAGALGLLGYGIFNIIKFVKGLRSRR